MIGRGKGGSEWDEDFNDSSNAQYPDDESRDSVQLDHSKLYITNLPMGLAQEGLVDLFKKFGTVEHSFVSRNPAKKFAIIKFETAGEARVAMMKLNRTEPLKLNINIAHKKKPIEKQNAEKPRTDRQMDNPVYSDRKLDKMIRSRDELSSVSSKQMTKRSIMEGHINGDEIDNESEDSEMAIDYNSNLHYNLETLKLKQLELKEKQLRCQERILIMQQAEKMKNSSGPQTKRRILPNGQIVISNSFDTSQENETGYTVGAGDSHNIPGLQRVASRRCVACGAAAEAYCGRCGVTPYCGEQCQRRDWADRHHAVCHNLARLVKDVTVSEASPVNDELVIPPPAPLRRPRSPAQSQREPPRSNTSECDKKFLPHGERQTAFQQCQRRQDNRSNRPERTGAGTDPVPQTRPAHPGPSSNRGEGNRYHEQTGRYPQEKDRSQGDQDKRNGQGYRLQMEQKDEAYAPRRSLPQPESKPKAAEQPPKTPAPDAKPETSAVPGTIRDVTPRRPVVPTSCVIEKLSVGATFLSTVESRAADGATAQPGYVCVTLHEDFGHAYTQLCDEFAEQCARDAADHTPRIGETFAYLNAEDGGWYRARCLSRTRAALIDAGRVVSHSPQRSRRLPAAYASVPEFSAVINTAQLELNMNLSCTLVSPVPGGYKVTLENTETAMPVGEGHVSRWTPNVEYPAPAAEVIAASVKPGQIPAKPSSNTAGPEARPAPPEVPRPDVSHNTAYFVVDVTSLRRVCVKPCDLRAVAAFDAALQDTVMYGIDAVPLTAPPQKGQTVVAKFTDGVHYRAFVKRTNVAKNKYLIEYIEYGNEETIPLERLYPCPEHLSLTAKPTQVSVVKISDREPDKLTSSAAGYVDKFKDDAVELTLMIPGGAKTAPSGSQVILINPKNSEPVSKRIEELCTPEWKILEERGGDALELESRRFRDLKFIPLPQSRPFVARVTNKYTETLVNGFVNGYEKGAPLADQVYGELHDQINEYAQSKLCKEPYLPKAEELCIVKNPETDKWMRGVLLELAEGPGGGTARVLYIDHGDVVCAPVGNLRRMPPEYADHHPALACHLEIKDFPESPTQAQLERAFQFFNVSEEGFCDLHVDSCRSRGNVNSIEVKALIAALK